MGKVVLDGSESRVTHKHNSISSENKGFYYFQLPNKNTNFVSGSINVGFSDYFKFVSGNAQSAFNNNSSGIWWEGNTINCYLIMELTTVQEVNTWLSTHNTEIVYKLATPITTEITDQTFLAQLETLINMKTYKDITNIESTGTDLAPVLDCDYYQDMSTLNDRLDELEARIELLEE